VKDWVGRTDASTSTKKVDADKPPVAGGDMDKDTFLKLLVAQLRYQDPSKPADGTEFVSETAQFTSLEKLTDLATAQQSMLTAQLQLGATQLVGREIAYLDKNGKAQTGVVTAATVTGSTPMVKVGDTEVALSSVQEVRSSAADAKPATP
jgi:flagellar basal-body rod modification protein FlgD